MVENGLIAGLGIRCRDDDVEFWHPYTEEEIIRSKYRRHSKEKVYKVNYKDKEHLVFGIYGICQLLNYFPNEQLLNISVERIKRDNDIPNLNIVRLNKPLN